MDQLTCSKDLTLFLCGDVMLGRGIDQILQSPSDPALFEEYARSAIRYVELAEAAHGRIPRHEPPDYVWGDALPIMTNAQIALRIINLETAVTTSAQHWPKGINYRMHPANVACLQAARVDCCVLANNHVLDWGREGLLETLDTLQRAGIATTGAGRDAAQARSASRGCVCRRAARAGVRLRCHGQRRAARLGRGPSEGRGEPTVGPIN